MEPEKSTSNKVFEKIKDITFAMMATVSEDGSIHSRPMATLKTDEESFDGHLWFFSKKNSSHIYTIEDGQEVNLTYINPENQNCISISGKASISNDRKKMKELWNPFLKAWIPDGLDDPETCLFSVNIENAVIWESTKKEAIHLSDFSNGNHKGNDYPYEKSH